MTNKTKEWFHNGAFYSWLMNELWNAERSSKYVWVYDIIKDTSWH